MSFKKLKLWFLFLLAILLANTGSAALEDLNLLHQQPDTQDSMVWPMLPNESLAQLATKFYPNNKAMQRKFIAKTKRLNAAKLNANTQYDKVTAITIPNLHHLSAQAGVIKRAKKKPQGLRMSNNIASEEKSTFSIVNIPQRLIRQYEELLLRNEFLKTELAKLNKRLEFLELKLGQLKLMMDKTLSLPPKKLKNLDAEPAVAVANKMPEAQAADKVADVVEQKKAATQQPIEKKTVKQPKDKNKAKEDAAGSQPKKKVQPKNYFDVSNKLLWAGLAIFGLVIVVGSHLISKYREKKYTKLVGAISQQKPTEKFEATILDVPDTGALLNPTTPGPSTILEEQTDQSVLQEAKTMMKNGSPADAVGHLKWAIRAKPKTSINTWLYLIDILRQQNSKDEFEKFALEMHQHFNVMTPLWEEEKAVEVVVPQTLEEFPYIVKFLTDKWPNAKLNNYLKKLVSDNRSGERSGFSQAVIEEIMLLADVLALRAEVIETSDDSGNESI